MNIKTFNKELGQIIENVVKEEILKTVNINEEEAVCNECGLTESKCNCSVNESDSEMEEGNEFTGARADAIEKGEDSFEVDGKEYPVTESSKGKKVLRLTESELIDLIEKIVSEQKVPGLDAYEKAHKESGKFNTENDKEVSKKMTEYSDVEGNTEDEFPNQNGGEIKGERTEDSEDIDFIDDMKGGMHALEYDHKPEGFDENVEKQLEGDSTQGNAQVDEDGEPLGNVVPSKTGERVKKTSERQGLNKAKKQGYNTFPQKVETVKESMINDKVLSDMDKMKHLLSYQKKTQ